MYAYLKTKEENSSFSCPAVFIEFTQFYPLSETESVSHEISNCCFCLYLENKKLVSLLEILCNGLMPEVT